RWPCCRCPPLPAPRGRSSVGTAGRGAQPSGQGPPSLVLRRARQSGAKGGGSESAARDRGCERQRRAVWAPEAYSKSSMTHRTAKLLFITRATRGLGLAIAERAARDGACIAVVGKTAEPHAKPPGTVDSACAAIEAAGGRALPCVCDIRFEA